MELTKKKLFKIASYIICVYVPSFMLIHLKPTASEEPFFTLFQRDILLAYRDIDTEIADVALKYFLKYATCWLSPKNVALSVYGGTHPYSVEAVKVCMIPDTVDIKSHLMDRTTRLKAPCISYSRIPPQFWKTIHNNNRSNERRIGRLENIVNDKIGDEPSQMNKTDQRLRALLCNMQLDKSD